MTFSGEQARGGVQSDPAGAGDIGFAPGVQVGEIGAGSGRAVERFFIGGELDQITRYKTCSNAQMA